MLGSVYFNQHVKLSLLNHMCMSIDRDDVGLNYEYYTLGLNKIKVFLFSYYIKAVLNVGQAGQPLQEKKDI